MKRFAMAAIGLVLVSSSLAAALARRHDAWDGMVLGVRGSKIRGVIALVGGKTVGTTQAEVSYKGDVAGVTRPWHVHVGSCARGGAVLGGAKAYSLLRVTAQGTAEGKATLRVPLPDSGSYYVSIHESAASLSKIIACGDFVLAE